MHLISLLPAATIHVFAPTKPPRSSVTVTEGWEAGATSVPPAAPCFGVEKAILVLVRSSWAGG